MQGTDVYGVLQQIRATHLYHANSVTTSCTFLEEAGLVSRGLVEDHGLKQTPQPSSDEIDKKYGIWHSVFLDHVNIHERAGKSKGPNYYGPVLFVLDLKILLSLPENTEVLVTKVNPVHWYDGQPDGDRWFQSPEELAKDIHFGEFHKMLVIQTPSEKVDFPDRLARIFLDDPQRQMPSGENAYTHAEKRLNAAAANGGVKASIERHRCRTDCKCAERYATYDPRKFYSFFS